MTTNQQTRIRIAERDLARALNAGSVDRGRVQMCLATLRYELHAARRGSGGII